jgi:hypothetical protein
MGIKVLVIMVDYTQEGVVDKENNSIMLYRPQNNKFGDENASELPNELPKQQTVFGRGLGLCIIFINYLYIFREKPHVNSRNVR